MPYVHRFRVLHRLRLTAYSGAQDSSILDGMDAPPPPRRTEPRLSLLIAEADPDGGHTGTRLSAQTAAGQAVRLRRGIYAPLERWLTAAPWQRYEFAVAAAAWRDPARVFCRETALLLHGVPLASTPEAVTQRTSHRGDVGIRSTPPLLGMVNRRQQQLLMTQWSQRLGRRLREKDLSPIPLRRHLGVLPGGVAEQSWTGAGRISQHQRVGAEALPGVHGPAVGYHVESLGLALADTLPRLPFAETMVAADAVLAGRYGGGPAQSVDQLLDWMPWASSQRAAARFRRILDFADARAESPGESMSRAVIRQLGFEDPELQVVIDTDAGRRYGDFGWRGGRIIGEFDGKAKYLDSVRISGDDAATVLWKEKRRQEAVERTGRLVARWGWEELQRPHLLEKILLAKGVPRSTGP